MGSVKRALLVAVTLVFCLALVGFAASCGRHKASILPPQPESLYTQGLKDFHLGTPEGYARAVDSFRKALLQRARMYKSDIEQTIEKTP